MDLNQEPLLPPPFPRPQPPPTPPNTARPLPRPPHPPPPQKPPDLFPLPPEDFQEEEDYFIPEPPHGEILEDFLEKHSLLMWDVACDLRNEIIDNLRGPLQFHAGPSLSTWY